MIAASLAVSLSATPFAPFEECLRTNIVYIKVPKSASSTTGGVMRRIAAKHGLSGYNTSKWIQKEPGVWANHGTLVDPKKAPNEGLLRKLKLPSFHVTVLREPAVRCLSAFYHFKVSRGDKTPSAENKIAALSKCRDAQYHYIKLRQNMSTDAVLDYYHHVGAVERYNEAMVAIATMLRLPLTDVLYVASKNSSENRRDPRGYLMATHTQLADEEPEVVAFANGPFRKFNTLDYALWEAAVAQADRSAQDVAFAGRLRQYTEMQDLVYDRCAIRVNSENKSISSLVKCYWNDNGCNYDCIDRLFDSGGHDGTGRPEEP